ncbi:DUF433 domain-containing protein [Aetokthonos hydrillicola Thurmond2011]|jgi:uncharacterized protein (DUF433 family)|uniref:DUF433 domain-containing protein n=1 Tax=Aetokthonos hydrillicola Thurmond2011 TaxID=2712845 RepID=A0AAP5IG50_9CYAN|nr:DUF433 domain-containing protein [Aetokthonos hydrillicola]MBO3459778.1 DUF433 domain-containing protein [Aetokthonos hydrillicola CCALA 1050]MBW4585211.1 DUF433 domain-containing protein [Aetokthonos hydrillicola CCALA 1050]MDR9899547.1 DUF433 domain-containing protein [Aetokthonos hydrillicola Thurmond2011]
MNQTTTTEYKHILVDEHNVPFIEGSSMKIVELVTSVHAYGWSPEELHFQYPHLSMSQIYSALAYYWEHKEEIDADMKRRFDYAERLRKEAGESPLAKRLRTQGLIK